MADPVQDALAFDQRIEALLTKASPVELRTEDRASGLEYTATFDGVAILEDHAGLTIYVTEDAAIALYDGDRLDLRILPADLDPEEIASILQDRLPVPQFIEAMNVLGITPKVAV
jgi:hypothetical protein